MTARTRTLPRDASVPQGPPDRGSRGSELRGGTAPTAAASLDAFWERWLVDAEADAAERGVARIADLEEIGRQNHTGVGPQTLGVARYVFEWFDAREYRTYQISVLAASADDAAIVFLRRYQVAHIARFRLIEVITVTDGGEQHRKHRGAWVGVDETAESAA